MTGASVRGHVHKGKADFSDIYDCPDPRRYFERLQPLDYQIPQHAQAVFRTLIDALHRQRPAVTPTVLDLCCSYGINAALLNHTLTLSDLYTHYTDKALTRLTARQLADIDVEFFARSRRPDAVPVVGLDSAARAVRYATSVGLLQGGYGENLEAAPASERLRHAAARTVLVTVTGGIGYIYAKTFERLLECLSTPPWVAVFALRTVPYQPIADLLAAHGLVTERLRTRTFRQRRFTNARERDATLAVLAKAGLDARGREADGYYHTDLYLSRPRAEAAALPLGELLPDPVAR
ncbi:hypothetical protein [Streptomyces sp. NPDC002088]|uniref:hypothetical protein n=1 Tax=Streptomyces sp. NPDC002088 TaxID=3154665 RepID=UPI0033178A03